MPAAPSPLQCAPGPDKMTSQHNVFSIQVTSGTSVVANYSEKVLQVAMHDQNAGKTLVRDQARIQPLVREFPIEL